MKEYLGTVSSVPAAQSQSAMAAQCEALNKLLAEKDVEIAALKKQVEQLKQQVNGNSGSNSTQIDANAADNEAASGEIPTINITNVSPS